MSDSTMTNSAEARLTDLEVRYSYLEHLVQQLDELVRDQADQVGRLTAQVDTLRGMLDEAGLSSDVDPGHEPPPHY